MSTVLVTGASGRIGRKLVPLLLENDYRVRATIHSRPLPEEWAREVISFSFEEGIAEAVAGADAIVHLAGIMPPVSDDVVFQTNIEATYRLLQETASQRQIPRVIFASSDATYCTGWSLSGYSRAIEEDSTAQHPTVFYGLSKVIGERFCEFFHEIRQVPTIALRFVWTLEPLEILDLFTTAPYKEFLLPEDASNWSKREIIAMPLEQNGTPFMEHVCDARDAARAVLGALRADSAVGHAINVAGPAPFLYTDLSPVVARKMNSQAVAGRCAGIHSYSLNIDKARRLLGFEPRYRIEDSLEEAFDQVARNSSSLKN